MYMLVGGLDVLTDPPIQFWFTKSISFIISLLMANDVNV